MTKTELKLATTIANYAADQGQHFHAINVSIENGTITMNTIENDDGLFETPFIIATFETQDQAIEWANDGRRNWRTLRAAVTASEECQGYGLREDVANYAAIHNIAEPTILVDDDQIISLDQYRAATAFLDANPITLEQYHALLAHQQATKEWTSAKNRETNRILNELLELDLGYVVREATRFGPCLSTTETGLPIATAQMNEWKAANPCPIFDRPWAN